MRKANAQSKSGSGALTKRIHPEPERQDVTKEPASNGGGNIIKCPRGCYMSGIQIWRDHDPSNQHSIRVWWSPPSRKTPDHSTKEGPFMITEQLAGGCGDPFRCWAGYHISDLQIVKGSEDIEPHFFRGINVWMTPLPTAFRPD
jgi:hypothetical protein